MSSDKGPLPAADQSRAAVNAGIRYFVIWVIAIVTAALLDRPVALWMREHGMEQFLHEHKYLRESLRIPGNYWGTLCFAGLAAIASRERWWAALFVLLATAVSGLNGLIKWIVGRTRPFKLHDNLLEPWTLNPLRGGLRGLFNSTNLSFPSGDAALAFATAAAVAILWPRWRWVFYIVAGLVAVERVAENAHWVSDTVAAAALGVTGANLIRWIWWDRKKLPATAING